MVAGLRIDPNVQVFTFLPSLGIIAAQVEKLGLDIRSFREPLKRSIQQVLAPSFRTNFEVGGRPSWEPLAPYTIQKKGGNTRPLIRSGKLMRVIQQLNIWTITPNAASLQDLPEAVWYGKVHQAGIGTGFSTTIRNAEARRQARGSLANIPQRQFVMIQDQDIEAIDEVFSKWLMERMIRSGFVSV